MTHGQLICTRCGQEGHVAASCPLPVLNIAQEGPMPSPVVYSPEIQRILDNQGHVPESAVPVAFRTLRPHHPEHPVHIVPFVGDVDPAARQVGWWLARFFYVFVVGSCVVAVLVARFA